MCDPILVNLLKIWPHYSQSSRENATPSSGTSPLASYEEVPPPPPGWDLSHRGYRRGAGRCRGITGALQIECDQNAAIKSPGGTPGNSWWWCTAWLSKSWPYIFQTQKCHFSHSFSDLASEKLCHHYLDWNTNGSDFLNSPFLFVSYSFGIERINTRSYNPVVPSKTIPDSRPKWTKSITVFRPKQTLPFGAAHTYMAHTSPPDWISAELILEQLK